MTLFAPIFLWLFLPLGLLLWWRFKRSNESRLDVSTLLLWRKLVENNKSAVSVRQPMNWRVILEALVGVLLIVALSDPRFEGDESLLVLVDQGGSMAAPQRRAHAEAVAKRFLDNRQSSLLRRFAPENRQTASPWRHALADSWQAGMRVELITDSLSADDNLPFAMGVTIIEEPVANWGIVAARAELEDSGKLNLFVAVAHTQSVAGSANRLMVRFEGSDQDQLIHDLKAGSRSRESFILPIDVPRDVQSLTLRLEESDDLSFDNAVTLWRPRMRGRLVIESSKKNTASTLAAIHDAALALRLRPYGSEGVNAEPQDVVVSAGRPRSEFSAALVVACDLLPSSKLREPVRADTIEGSLSEVPGLSSWRFGRGFAEPLPDKMDVLVRAAGMPVVLKDNISNSVLIADDPMSAGWTEQAFFPLLIRAFLAELGLVGIQDPDSWLPKKPSSVFMPAESLALSTPEFSRPSEPGRRVRESMSPWLGLLAAILVMVLLALDLPAIRPVST